MCFPLPVMTIYQKATVKAKRQQIGDKNEIKAPTSHFLISVGNKVLFTFKSKLDMLCFQTDSGGVAAHSNMILFSFTSDPAMRCSLPPPTPRWRPLATLHLSVPTVPSSTNVPAILITNCSYCFYERYSDTGSTRHCFLASYVLLHTY